MNDFQAQFQTVFGHPEPASLTAWAEGDERLTTALSAYGSGVPERVCRASESGFPGTQDDQVWLVTENQGVCVWLAPASTGAPVLVAADHLPAPVVYAADPTALVDGWVWDASVLGRETLLQAQAAPGGNAHRQFLSRLSLVGTTRAWPSETNQRFESRDGLQVLVWQGEHQWDWWVSAEEPEVLAAWLPQLRELLGEALWANDDAGAALLD